MSTMTLERDWAVDAAEEAMLLMQSPVIGEDGKMVFTDTEIMQVIAARIRTHYAAQEVHLTSREAKGDGLIGYVHPVLLDSAALAIEISPVRLSDAQVPVYTHHAAQEAAKPVGEVDDAMIDRAMTAYDEFLGSDDEADYEAMRAALIAATQDWGE